MCQLVRDQGIALERPRAILAGAERDRAADRERARVALPGEIGRDRVGVHAHVGEAGAERLLHPAALGAAERVPTAKLAERREWIRGRPASTSPALEQEVRDCRDTPLTALIPADSGSSFGSAWATLLPTSAATAPTSAVAEVAADAPGAATRSVRSSVAASCAAYVANRASSSDVTRPRAAGAQGEPDSAASAAAAARAQRRQHLAPALLVRLELLDGIVDNAARGGRLRRRGRRSGRGTCRGWRCGIGRRGIALQKPGQLRVAGNALQPRDRACSARRVEPASSCAGSAPIRPGGAGRLVPGAGGGGRSRL